METTITRSGRVVQAPTRLIEVAGLSGNYEIKLMAAEVEYFATIDEIGELACV